MHSRCLDIEEASLTSYETDFLMRISQSNQAHLDSTNMLDCIHSQYFISVLSSNDELPVDKPLSMDNVTRLSLLSTKENFPFDNPALKGILKDKNFEALCGEFIRLGALLGLKDVVGCGSLQQSREKRQRGVMTEESQSRANVNYRTGKAKPTKLKPSVNREQTIFERLYTSRTKASVKNKWDRKVYEPISVRVKKWKYGLRI